jgi:1-acyl-sn-glycerol-3-phosphate acyltransferase
VTQTPTGAPRWGSAFTQRLARWVLGLFGWKVEGALPEEPRFVLIVGPHTSNTDFYLGVLAKIAIGIGASWLGKHTIFVFPMGGILRWFGGEPVDRSANQGIVEAAIERFRTRPQWVLAMAPEGTRRRVEQWKTGFYRIAIGAGVPILPVTFDYSRRVVDMGTLYWPTGDETIDMRELRSRYKSSMGKHPEGYVE